MKKFDPTDMYVYTKIFIRLCKQTSISPLCIAIVLLSCTDLSLEELVTLDWYDLDIKNQVLYVHGENPRRFWLSQDLIRFLLYYRCCYNEKLGNVKFYDSGRIVCSNYGTNYTEYQLSEKWFKYIRKDNFKNVLSLEDIADMVSEDINNINIYATLIP